MSTMDLFIDDLNESIVDFTIKYTNISSEVKKFLNNTNIAMKTYEKIDDLVTKNLYNENDKDILKDLHKTMKAVQKISVKNNKLEIPKCKYQNRGYSKLGQKCSFRHCENICEEFTLAIWRPK